ncbi:MAG: ribonuclease HI family protein [bacterium]
MNHHHLRIYTDGGSRGNPGPAGIGGAIYAIHEDGTEELVAEVSEYIGETTNNQAEYRAIIASLTKALEFHPEKIDMRMDSELAVKQIRGEYKVKNQDLAMRFLEVKNLCTKFKNMTWTHVRRERNTAADALVNLAIDQAMNKRHKET